MTKAIFPCILTSIGLIFPTGVLLVFLERFLGSLVGIEAPVMRMTGYMGISVLFLVIIFAVERLQYNTAFLASYKESTQMRIRLAERLRTLPLSLFRKGGLVDLTATTMVDHALIGKVFPRFIPELMGALVLTMLIGIGPLVADWRMGLVVLWVAPVSFLPATGTRPTVGQMERRQKGRKIAVSDGVQECIENTQDIKANSQREGYPKGLDQKFLNMRSITIGLELLNGTLVTISQMSLKIGMAITVLAGASFLVSRSIDFIAFLMFILTAIRLYLPLAGCLQNLSAVYSTLLVVGRMKGIKEQPVQQGNKSASYKGYDIIFDHVGFSYKDGEQVPKDMSFTARQGQITALVSPSGRGRSTSAKLATRFWDIDKGKTTPGGMNINSVGPETLLGSFPIVLQDAVLFNNAIVGNICLRRGGVTDQEVISVTGVAQCEGSIRRLPDGYHARIEENGSILSGDERQRLSIAKALLRDAPVVFVDGATVSLDVEDETLVQKATSSLVKDKAVLITTHRVRIVAGADRIVVLEDGLVAEQGTPRELMDRNGVYRYIMEFQDRNLTWSL